MESRGNGETRDHLRYGREEKERTKEKGIRRGGRTGSNGRRSKEDAIMYNDLIGKSSKGK